MIRVERHQNGYIPVWIDRVEDCFIWRQDDWHTGRKWQCRVNQTFTTHYTLRDAKIEAARAMGLRMSA